MLIILIGVVALVAMFWLAKFFYPRQRWLAGLFKYVFWILFYIVPIWVAAGSGFNLLRQGPWILFVEAIWVLIIFIIVPRQ